MTPLPYETTLKDVESRPDCTELRRAEFFRMIGPPHEFLAAFIMSIAGAQSSMRVGRPTLLRTTGQQSMRLPMLCLIGVSVAIYPARAIADSALPRRLGERETHGFDSDPTLSVKRLSGLTAFVANQGD